MPQWRCPHCQTPQAETSRCWVCKRSSTSCGTCRHFRLAIAGQLGYCGLDRRRLPLVGDELRGCWTAPNEVPETPPRVADFPPLAATPRRLDFIPVGGEPAGESSPATVMATPDERREPRLPDPWLWPED